MMNQGLLQMLLKFFKTLSDENRLKIIGLLDKQEYSVGDLAEALDLTAPTVSHHISKLREIGLVNLRAEGTSRYYRLNTEMLERIKGHMFRLDEVYEVVDHSWVDALQGFDEWERKVLRDYTVGNQRIKSIPTREKKLLVVLRWLATQFEPGARYAESDVNEILARHHEDYARLRRELINFRFLKRAPNGGVYWVEPAPPA